MSQILLFSLLVPVGLAAQHSPAVPLKPANGSVSAAFRHVSSMRELSDGRVLLSDMMANQFGVGDFSAGRFEKIANLNPRHLVTLPGDSSFMFGTDVIWVFLDGARPIGMLDRGNPVIVAAKGWVFGADASGHVLGIAGGASDGDSSTVGLIDRVTGEVTPITQLWVDQRPTPSDASGIRPFLVFEQAVLTLDGWIAVLRHEPYRIDWRTPDGNWILGAPIPAPVVKMTEREKVAWMRSNGSDKPPSAISRWPESVPPWVVGWAPFPSPDGRLVVLRTSTVDAPNTRYDVINRRGELERQITMPANEHIVGFGAKSVYVAVGAKGGEQAIQRHPWP